MNTSSHVARFHSTLLKACSLVGDDYMEARAAEGVSYWSERVYAYELYHQLRRCWPGDGTGSPRYCVNGELPKFRNPVVRLWKTPDLLIHVPETMKHNLAAIEIKPFERIRRVTKDIATLRELRFGKGRYKSAYLVIFGGSGEDILTEWKQIARQVRFQPSWATVICHPAVGSPYTLVC